MSTEYFEVRRSAGTQCVFGVECNGRFLFLIYNRQGLSMRPARSQNTKEKWIQSGTFQKWVGISASCFFKRFRLYSVVAATIGMRFMLKAISFLMSHRQLTHARKNTNLLFDPIKRGQTSLWNWGPPVDLSNSGVWGFRVTFETLNHEPTVSPYWMVCRSEYKIRIQPQSDTLNRQSSTREKRARSFSLTFCACQRFGSRKQQLKTQKNRIVPELSSPRK